MSAERLAYSSDLQHLLGTAARPAHADGTEVDVTHIRRALDGEQACEDPLRDQQGLVAFAPLLRDALVAAHGFALGRGERAVGVGDLVAALTRSA